MLKIFLKCVINFIRIKLLKMSCKINIKAFKYKGIYFSLHPARLKGGGQQNLNQPFLKNCDEIKTDVTQIAHIMTDLTSKSLWCILHVVIKSLVFYLYLPTYKFKA